MLANEFKREPRYIVFKVSDLGNSLKGDDIRALAREYAEYRQSKGKPPLECVVVESDWPEYEPTWAAIEARMTGHAIEAEVLQSQPLTCSGCGSSMTDAELAIARRDRGIIACCPDRKMEAAPKPPAPCPRCEYHISEHEAVYALMAASTKEFEGKVSRALGEKHWFRHELRSAKNRISDLEAMVKTVGEIGLGHVRELEAELAAYRDGSAQRLATIRQSVDKFGHESTADAIAEAKP